MKVGSLFSGIGGFDRGFENAGMSVAWQCEINPDCQKVLRHHWPEARLYGDITQVSGGEIAPVDVITAGFPCQDLSVAGKRAGLDGARSGLFFEVVRIIREMGEATDGLYPTFLVLENVPGLLSSNRGRDFAVVLREVAESGALDIAWAVLDAQWFGVAQRRRRVFIVADFRGQRADEVLSIPYGCSGDSPPRREAGKEVAGSLGGGSGQRGWCNDLDRSGAFIPGIPHPALQARQLIPFDTTQITSKEANRSNPQPGDPCHPLAAGTHAPAIAGMTVRRLTPLECTRLQGFPDSWLQGLGLSDSAMYRCLGNAVAVPPAEWIGRRLVEVDRQ